MYEKTYYVYILANQNHHVLYTGITNDIISRVYEHKNKIFKGFTEKYNVTNLVYYEMFDDVLLAIAREKQIKSWKRNRKDDLIIKFNPKWRDLYWTLI